MTVYQIHVRMVVLALTALIHIHVNVLLDTLELIVAQVNFQNSNQDSTSFQKDRNVRKYFSILITFLQFLTVQLRILSRLMMVNTVVQLQLKIFRKNMEMNATVDLFQ